MTCPDSNRIIDLALGDAEDLEADAHLRECQDCRATAWLLREIPGAMRPDITVPHALNQRTLAALEALDLEEARVSVRPRYVVSAALLGATTALAATVVTGAIAAGGLIGLLAVSLGGGVSGVVYEFLSGRSGDPSTT